jgi:preprotein translocase subunit SecA
MMDGIKEELASLVFNVQVTVEGDGSEIKAAGIAEKSTDVTALQYTASDESGVSTKGAVSRNSQCPCGSGKKYKRCHGAA